LGEQQERLIAEILDERALALGVATSAPSRSA